MNGNMKAVSYILLNVAASLAIVFSNKAVFAIFQFPYPFLLTLIHITFTAFGMRLLALAGFFEPKTLPWRSLIDLTLSYVGYIVLGNLSIKINPVGFYQIIKALIPPAVLLMQSLQTFQVPSGKIMASVALLTVGVVAATVTDDEVMGNVPGMLTGLVCVFATAGYNILAGSKQKQLNANSSQLCMRFAPLAAATLALSLPLVEPQALRAAAGAAADDDAAPEFRLTAISALVILLSAALGLLVTLSTFLVIGATSALTYNVVGHVKTVGVIAGGVMIYGEAMPLKKFLGIVIMAGGIGWYSQIKLSEAPVAKQAADEGGAQDAQQSGATPAPRGGLAKVATGRDGDGPGDVARGYPGQVVSPRKATLFDK